jgi:hypothetical protein
MQGQIDFATLSSRESHCSSASRGGDLGEFGPGQMQKAFEDVTYSLQVSILSCNVCVVLSGDYWHETEQAAVVAVCAGRRAQLSSGNGQWHPLNPPYSLMFFPKHVGYRLFSGVRWSEDTEY